MKLNHPKLSMDMHNILTTHDVIRVGVKIQHATYNASIFGREYIIYQVSNNRPKNTMPKHGILCAGN
jgi:hypothetical protein